MPLKVFLVIGSDGVPSTCIDIKTWTTHNTRIIDYNYVLVYIILLWIFITKVNGHSPLNKTAAH